jgi:hypothetical protein
VIRCSVTNRLVSIRWVLRSDGPRRLHSRNRPPRPYNAPRNGASQSAARSNGTTGMEHHFLSPRASRCPPTTFHVRAVARLGAGSERASDHYGPGPFFRVCASRRRGRTAVGGGLTKCLSPTVAATTDEESAGETECVCEYFYKGIGNLALKIVPLDAVCLDHHPSSRRIFRRWDKQT